MRRRIAVVDFDGTIVESAFPDVGDPMPEAFEVMQELRDAGYVLVLNTCREDEKRGNFLTEALDFCRDHGIEFDGVNETPLEFEFRDEDSPRRKPYGHVYIDDRNLGGFPGWAEVRKMLLG